MLHRSFVFPFLVFITKLILFWIAALRHSQRTAVVSLSPSSGHCSILPSSSYGHLYILPCPCHSTHWPFHRSAKSFIQQHLLSLLGADVGRSRTTDSFYSYSWKMSNIVCNMKFPKYPHPLSSVDHKFLCLQMRVNDDFLLLFLITTVCQTILYQMSCFSCLCIPLTDDCYFCPL